MIPILAHAQIDRHLARIATVLDTVRERGIVVLQGDDVVWFAHDAFVGLVLPNLAQEDPPFASALLERLAAPVDGAIDVLVLTGDGRRVVTRLTRSDVPVSTARISTKCGDA
jgi:hypothetical protein